MTRVAAGNFSSQLPRPTTRLRTPPFGSRWRSAASRGDKPRPTAMPRATSGNLRTASPSSPSGADRTPNGSAPSLVDVERLGELIGARHDRRALVIAREALASDDRVGLRDERLPHAEPAVEQRIAGEHDRARTGRPVHRPWRASSQIRDRVVDGGDELELVGAARLARRSASVWSLAVTSASTRASVADHSV